MNAKPRRGRSEHDSRPNVPPHVEDDKPSEECGLFAIWNSPDAAAHTALGLHALQHRGQESAGIVSFDGERFHNERDLGLVGDIFGDPSVIARLKGSAAVGHVRYSTTGETIKRNIQPLFAELVTGGFAVGHNGNLTNGRTLRRQLVRQGSLFQSTTDTEVIIGLMAASKQTDVVDKLIDAVRQVEGAYSLVALTDKGVIGLRDPLGVRPLCLGRLGDTWILTSETCALDIIGADFVRDIEPGELIVLGAGAPKSLRPFPPAPRRFCIFEHIYFARPDSMMEGMSVYDARTRIGAELARESHVPADVVIPVPDSGVPAAIGYAAEAAVPFELGIIRNHYVGRTFIEPTDHIRHLGVKLKHNANRARINGKRVVLVDDSIVRGTTSTKIVEMVRSAGATQVHMRISSPPTTESCYFGIDTPEREKLLAARHSVEEMAKLIGVDSLAFISIDGLYRAMGLPGRDHRRPQYCDACFTGDYPIALTDREEGGTQPQLALLAGRA
ncbi:MAG: amidophosphoribosyltransferase [Rhodospirillales bacterium]|nr:amidophosphoribosyltransferase [Rhodospirillales bacterium]